jgi:hypothetical protein
MTKIYFTCEWCKHKSERSVYEFKNAKHHFCSRDCFNKWRIKKVKITCEQCGNIVYKYPSSLKRSVHHFCSLPCARIYNGAMLSGENNPTKRLDVRYKMSRSLTGINKGNKNPNWKGGSSFVPYCQKFNNEIKELIREKFDRKCYLCDITERDNCIKLSVHHIDYNKNSICNGQDWALVPLCQKCHTKTNFNRWYWFNLLISYWIVDKEMRFYIL